MQTRRRMLASAVLGALMIASPAMAANAAEAFVSDNIHLGFDILNDKALSDVQRREKFATFLIGLSDLKRVALFLLGRYAATASAEDKDAFVAAFQDYTLAVYQSYFAQYSGQTLTVTGSRERAPNDIIVQTQMVDASSKPFEVDFRVRTDGPKPVLVDLGVGGVFLAVAQREEFSAVLSKSNGDIKALIAHLRETEQRYR